MHKFILIEKHRPSESFWTNLINYKKITYLSVEEVTNKYQGFEGDLISFFLISENNDGLDEYIDQCLELKKLSDCLLLHVLSGSAVMPSFLNRQTIKVGYDVGACNAEGTLYSSIFNEILFGNVEELVVFKESLNENLLFPDRLIAKKYIDMHHEMASQGRDVEEGVKMTIYEIWKYKG